VAEALTYTSSKGLTYRLYAEEATLKSGHSRTIYYFTAGEPKPAAKPVARLPEGYEIGEGRNGLPFLRKSD
jgi:hypothetical protein